MIRLKSRLRIRRGHASILSLMLILPVALPVLAQGRVDLAGLEGLEGIDRFIVKYRDDSPAYRDAGVVQQALDALEAGQQSADPIEDSAAPRLHHLRRGGVGADVVHVDRTLDRAAAEQLMRRIASDPDVEYVEVDRRLTPQMAPPSGPMYKEDWALTGTYGIQARKAWRMASGAGVVVAVVDTGITDHSALKPNVLPGAGYDFIQHPGRANDGDGRDSDPSDPGNWLPGAPPDWCLIPSLSSSGWHGTAMAGIIAAAPNDAMGIAGVAYEAKIVPVRVSGRCYEHESDIIDGIVWAAGGSVDGVPANEHPAEVLSVSIGDPGRCSVAMQTAINSAVGRGATVVFAAGNDDIDVSGYAPANCENVIAVGASTRNGGRWHNSNHGAKVDIAAPGVDILVLSNTGRHGPERETYEPGQAGTSISAAYVSGVVAQVQSALIRPLAPAQIEQLLKDTATPFAVKPSKPNGAGIVNAAKALETAIGNERAALAVLVAIL